MPRNTAPRINMQGFQDKSAVTPPIVPEEMPVFLPLVFGFAEKGDTDAKIVSGTALKQLYGQKTLDMRGPFATHASPLMEALLANQSIMFKRLRPANAATATLRLSIDIVQKELPVYDRNPDGSYVTDENGDPVESGTTITGHQAKWVLNEVTDGIGMGSQGTGSMTENTTDSTVYPIMDLELLSFGAWGSNFGLRIVSPTSQGTDPADVELAMEQKTFIHRAQLVQRADKFSSPNVVNTVSGAPYIDFALKEGAINTNVNAELSFDEVFINAYRDLEAETPKPGPFKSAYIYRDNLDSVLDMVFAEEQAEANLQSDEKYLIDLFSGRDLSGAPYSTYVVLDSMDGGTDFGETTTHYFKGGKDGDMGNTAYNEAVANELSNFGQLDVPFADMAKYPFSIMIDTGFDIDTKLLMSNVLGLRKDVSVVAVTQDVMKPRLSTSEESSMAVALRSSLRSVPESTLYGTATCRALVVGHAGKMVGSPYSKDVPAVIDLATKFSKYMGAGNGVFKGPYAPDVSPNNQVTFVRDINNTYKPMSVRNKDWSNGLIHAENYDTSSQFWPALQTIFDDPSSVLNNAINMFIAVELNKVCFRVWRDLVGNAKLSKDQFIQRSNELIVERTSNRFDGRVVVVPDTYFTEIDDANGYSWTCNIDMYGNTMKTVQSSTIITHRLEDLQ